MSHIYGAGYEDAADREDGAREQSAKDWAREQEGADLETPMPTSATATTEVTP